jgi:hypothetical protein
MDIEYKAYSSLFLWMFLPSLVTSVILRVCYFLRRMTTGRPAPPNKSTARQSHYKWLFTLIIGFYLTTECYQTIDARLNSPSSSFYAYFNVIPGDGFDHKALKSAFRKLSLKYHPDRVRYSHVCVWGTLDMEICNMSYLF